MSTEIPAATQLPRATYASMVTERLRANIVNGTLAQGSQLGEVELASAFGVSRGPVREALQRLIQEGLVRSEPHRGVFVPLLNDDDVRDIYLARDALESSAVRHIIASGKSPEAADELDRLVKLMQESEKANDWEAVGQYDLEFHTALVSLSGSERLQRMFSTVISETRLCLGVLTAADARSDLVEEHSQIAKLIRAGRTEEALSVLKDHFDDAVETIKSRDHDTGDEKP